MASFVEIPVNCWKLQISSSHVLGTLCVRFHYYITKWYCSLVSAMTIPFYQLQPTEMTHCWVVSQLWHPSMMWEAAVWTVATRTQQCTDVSMLNTSAQSTQMLNELYDWQHLSDQPTCVQSENSFLHILHTINYHIMHMAIHDMIHGHSWHDTWPFMTW